jgi:hypothetical protein
MVQIENLMNTMMDSDPPLQKRVGVITSVPGLSISGALTILSEIGDIRRFKTYRSFLNYAGLVPTIYISGEMSRIGRINRKSNKFLRTAFYHAGKTIATIIKEKSDLKDYAGRMLVRYGKGKMVYMKIAVKVARTVYFLLKKGEWYNPVYERQEMNGNLENRIVGTKLKRKTAFRKMANWLIRKKDFLPPDLLVRMRKVLKIE